MSFCDLLLSKGRLVPKNNAFRLNGECDDIAGRFFFQDNIKLVTSEIILNSRLKFLKHKLTLTVLPANSFRSVVMGSLSVMIVLETNGKVYFVPPLLCL